MGFRFPAVCLLAACSAAGAGPSVPPRDWENPAVFERGQEPPRAAFTSYPALEQAKVAVRKRSPWTLSLNGDWRFRFDEVPEDAPGDFQRPGFDDRAWALIRVPGNWQMQGFGWAQFRNVHQPFPARPPWPPPEYNPTGSYRTVFTLPPAWRGMRTLLHFEAAKSAATVWLNGRELGYNEGGFEPFEFDATPFLSQGENTLAVRVLGYSDGTYLECQDMWRLFGLHRDVFLSARPALALQDAFVTTDLDGKARDAVLRVRAEVRNAGDAAAGAGSVAMHLFDPAGRPVFSGPVRSLFRVPASGGTAGVVIEKNVRAPRLWSAEKPDLYTVVLEVRGPGNAVPEFVPFRVGFREVEVRGQALRVNGRAVKLNGVNSHVHHPVTGRAMDAETMRRDLVLMKRFNVNCVRTSHYPPNVEYLDLADELGMYVVDETGDEAHATEYLSEDPAWREAYVNRGRRMVLRDRNHPCIILWSAGNESGSGENISAVIREGKRLDPSRPAWCYGGNTDLLPFEDVVGPRYPDLHELADVAALPESVDPRPSFMDEYLAATGNSLGNLDEYWDLIWKNPRLTGGAVWDWISPGVLDSARFTPDASPRGNAGALLGRSRLVPGRFGNAVSLSGHDDWVEAYNDEALDPGFRGLTVEAWVFPRRWNGYGGFAAKGDAYGLEQKDWGTLAFYIRDGVRVEAAAPVPDEWEYRWHHLAGTYDGEKLLLYVDGKSVSAAPHQGAVDRSPHALAVGRSMQIVGMEHPGDLSNAVIDAVAVFPRALSPEEIGGMSAALRAESVLWWDFDEWSRGPRYYSLGIGARAYGLVWPDRTPQPELWQLKKSPQPVRFEMVDAAAGLVRVTNRHVFTDLAEFETVWRVESEGAVLEQGTLPLKVPPQTEAVVTVPFRRTVPAPGAETRLLLSVRLARDEAWAPAGHEVAWEEFLLGKAEPEGPADPGPVPLLEEAPSGFRVAAADLEARVDRTSGTLASLKHRGRELLVSGPVFSAWRAPTSNETERDWGGAPIADAWREAGLDRLATSVQSIDAETLRDRVRVTVRSKSSAGDGPSGFSCVWRYDFLGSGDVIVDVRAAPFGPMPSWLPKMGIQLTLSDSLRDFAWFGRGPFETYPDRKTGAKTGLYSGTVDEQFTPYLVPQDFGNKTDVRWSALSGPAGLGLFVSGDSLFNASVHHYGTDHLTRALYPFRLRKQDGVTLNLDPWVCGLGETPIKTQPKYRVEPREVRFRFRLRPFDGGREAALDLARTKAQ